MNTAADGLRILIACEHASAQFGGEAALPLHYFRVLRARGADVWLLAHARTRDELLRLFPGETRMRFIEDTRLNRAMWRLGMRLPAQDRLLHHRLRRRAWRPSSRSAASCGSSCATSASTSCIKPMPVSPREPSMLFGFGVPVSSVP
jgi:hypothetical protein